MIGGSILWLFLSGLDMGTAAEQLLNGMMGSQLLLAIPLFILAAEFMNTGSIMDRLLHFCNAIVGRFRGGLAQVNVVQSIIFASMSGSALADAAASGKLMQTMMTQGRQVSARVRRRADLRVVGHRADHPAVDPAGALCAGFGHVGRLSLPRRRDSGPAARRRPERLIAAVAKRRNFPVEERVPLRELPRVTWEALPALLMPVILLGCMWSGITTPTEAAAVAAAYALLISALLYRSVRWRTSTIRWFPARASRCRSAC